MYIVVSGSFTWGFTFNGPFPTRKDGLEWAATILDGRLPWDVVPWCKVNDYVDGSDSIGSWILVVGDACDGYSIVGLFDSHESALRWEDADSEGCSYIATHLSPIN